MPDRNANEILADPDSTHAEKLVASAYIRRLLITIPQAQEALDLAGLAGLEDDDAYTCIGAYLARISPFGQWHAGDGGPYPRPEETFGTWTNQAEQIRTLTEGLDTSEATDTFQQLFGSDAIRFALILARRS